MVQEELTAHDEEWNVVGGPCQEEEASAVVQARAGAWQMLAEMLIEMRNAKLTLIKRIHATTNADLVGQDDTREDSENR